MRISDWSSDVCSSDLKEQRLVSDLDVSERPLNQHWSWDRILRSCFIKQADVLQGLYFFEERYEEATLRRNFDFYEPRTVHESSLSPCIHSILAAKLKEEQRAYEFYLRTARLEIGRASCRERVCQYV